MDQNADVAIFLDKNSEITDKIKEEWQKIWKEAADFQVGNILLFMFC